MVYKSVDLRVPELPVVGNVYGHDDFRAAHDDGRAGTRTRLSMLLLHTSLVSKIQWLMVTFVLQISDANVV